MAGYGAKFALGGKVRTQRHFQAALHTLGAVSSYVNCKSRAPIKASGWACRVSSSARRSGALRKVSSARPRVN